jgi:hypothetical protein
MTYAYPAARRFVRALHDQQFAITWQQPYWNRHAVQGYCQVGTLRGRMFCISQSDSAEPDSPKRLAYIFKDDHVDQKQPVLFSNRDGRIALQAIAWYCSRGHKIFTPDTGQEDEFSELIKRVRCDVSVTIARSDWDEIDSLRAKLQELGISGF